MEIKCVYGLSDALFHCTLHLLLNLPDGVSSKLDPLLFLCYNKNNNLIGYILVHVEDFLFTGTQQFHKTIISKLRKTFQVVKENKLDFEYIGLNLVTTKTHISLDQLQYINNLKKIGIASDWKSNNTSPLKSSEKDQLRAKIKQLLWVSN